MDTKEKLKKLSDDRLLEVYRKYCEHDDSAKRVYKMSEFDTVLDNFYPSDIIAMTLNAKRFCLDDQYFVLNLGGSIESYTYLKSIIDFDKLSQFIEKNQDMFQDFLFRDCVTKDIIECLNNLSYKQICKVKDFIDSIEIIGS